MLKEIKLIVFIGLSLLIGAIYIYPDIRFIAELGDKFKGITLTAMPDEGFYLARLNAVYNGDYRLANIGLFEHRNDLWLNPPYFEVIVGLASKMLGIPVVYLDIILSFLFPIIIFWLIYLLALKLSNSIYLGILTGLSIVMAYNLFSFNPTLVKSILVGSYHILGLWFMRPFSPQLIYIPFIFSLLAVYCFIDSKTIWKLFAVSVPIAVLNCLHVHLWAFMYAGLSVWFFISILNKDKLIVKNILFIILTSLILAIPFWLNYYKVTLDPNYQFLETIFGTDYTHRPIIPFGYILLSIFAIYINKGTNSKNFFFVLSFLIGGLLCLNQQILTGKIIEPVHWTSYTNKTFLLLALITGLNNIKPKNFHKNIRNIIFISVVSFLFFTGFIQQYNYYNAHKNTFKERQNLYGVITWLNTNTSKNDVILTESIDLYSLEFIRMLMIYTHNYYYLAREAHSLISEEEFQYRLLAAMRFFNYTMEEAYQIIDFINGINFTSMSARYGVLKNKDEYLNKIKIKYNELMSKDPLSLMMRYKVDYLLIKKSDRFYENIESVYPSLNKVFDDGFYKIYKF